MAALLLAGCNSSPQDNQAAQRPTVTVTTTVTPSKQSSAPEKSTSTTTTTTAETTAPTPARFDQDARVNLPLDSMQQVRREYFTVSTYGVDHFRYTVDGSPGMCFSVRIGVACGGNPDPSVPDVEYPPFGIVRPSHIIISHAGMTYTPIEGVPNADDELRTGQYVIFDGIVCAKPDDHQVICQSESSQFRVSGASRAITTSGPVMTYDELDAKS